MEIIYAGNKQVVAAIKKLIIEKGLTQTELADKLGLKPQGLNKLLNKKNFGFEDVQKILGAMGYDLIVGFQKKGGHS